MAVVRIISWFFGGFGIFLVISAFIGSLMCAAGQEKASDGFAEKLYRWMFIVGLICTFVFLVLHIIIHIFV